MNFAETVIESYKKVLEDYPVKLEPSLEAALGAESGLDSLGLVNLMIEIEESLDISLESVLIEIRSSQKLSDIVRLVEKAYQAVGK
ncbi:phosphopantetheine-binding protein [Paenibacillus ihuae]|uniref:phosphopantetheine-binding protein n=1 Tax=Paenibacillus ihuae TaxID=1232431 RepID=UPI0006D55D36|nr:phosphopantetheine-binding protein [Paenibacillus ihuae]